MSLIHVDARHWTSIDGVSSPHLTHAAENGPATPAPVYYKLSENTLFIYRPASLCMKAAQNQAVACCPVLSGLWGAHLAGMKSTAYADFGAKTQFAP